MTSDPWGYAVAHLDEDGELLDWFVPISGEHQALLTYDAAVELRGDLDADWWSIVPVGPAIEASS